MRLAGLVVSLVALQAPSPTEVDRGMVKQIVPIEIASRRSVKILPNASLKEYAGAPHGMCVTHAGQVNADLLAFLKDDADEVLLPSDRRQSGYVARQSIFILSEAKDEQGTT